MSSKRPIPPDEDPGWEKAKTLDEWAVEMMLAGRINDPEFKTMLEIYGKERFRKLWKAHVAKKNPERK